MLALYGSVIKFISFCIIRIERTNMPFGEVFLSYLKLFPEEDLFEKTERDPLKNFYRTVKKLPLGESEAAEAEEFFSAFGKTFRDGQLKYFSDLKSILSSSRDEYAKNLIKKQKCIKTVSLLIGVLAVIILI